MKLHPPWRFLRVHRVIVSSVILILLAIGGYALWSNYTWESYKAHEREWRYAVQTELDVAINMRSEGDKGRQNKLGAIEKPIKTISAKQDSICKINALTEWQRLIKSFGDSERECIRTKSQFDKLKKALSELAAYVKNEYALVEILGDTPLDKAELAEDTWEGTATIWQQVAERLGKLAVHESFQPTKQTALSSVGAVSAAWQEVLAATKAKDRGGYEKAQALLVQAYSGMASIADTDTKQLNKLSSVLASIYKQL